MTNETAIRILWNSNHIPLVRHGVARKITTQTEVNTTSSLEKGEQAMFCEATGFTDIATDA